MKGKRKRRILPFWGRDDGAVAVEFIILFPLLLLIVVGIVEFGHIWYVDHVLTNASREGARAGVIFTSVFAPYSDRTTWAQNTAKTAVNKYLNPPDGNGKSMIPGVKTTTTATAGNNPGDQLTVTISASGVALVLDQVIPSFRTMTLKAVTTMRME